MSIEEMFNLCRPATLIKLTTLVRFYVSSVRTFSSLRLQQADIHQHEFLRILVMPSAGWQTQIVTITPFFYVEGTLYILFIMDRETAVGFRVATSVGVGLLSEGCR